MRPSQADEIIENGLRQVALILVLANVHRAMPFGELGTIGAENHRQVGIQPTKECRTHTAEMEYTGGAGSKSSSDGH